MRTKYILSSTILSLCMSFLGSQSLQAHSADVVCIDDKSLQKHSDYQRWKQTIVAVQACRELWSTWQAQGLTVHIVMRSPGRGATTKDYVFHDGKLKEATIEIEYDIGKGAPRNAAAYPILSSLVKFSADKLFEMDVRAAAFIAHEFGHVEHTRKLGETTYKRQQDLLRKSQQGFHKLGWDWFDQEEYRQIVRDLGEHPFNLMQQRERLAEATAIPVITHLFGENMPVGISKAIQDYSQKI